MVSKAKWILRVHVGESEKERMKKHPPFELVEDEDYLNTRLVVRVNAGYILEVLDARTRNLIHVPEDYILTSSMGLWWGVYVQPGLTEDAFLVEYV